MRRDRRRTGDLPAAYSDAQLGKKTALPQNIYFVLGSTNGAAGGETHATPSFWTNPSGGWGGDGVLELSCDRCRKSAGDASVSPNQPEQ